MREIKFRAWDKERQEMLAVKLMDFSQWWVSCDPHYGTSKPLEYGERNSFKNEQTDRHILMQYTGLKDKNGKEIYEGDICRTNDNGERFTEVATWDHEWAGWMFKSDYGTFNAAELRFEWLEVIGNIYENPELLEGGQA